LRVGLSRGFQQNYLSALRQAVFGYVQFGLGRKALGADFVQELIHRVELFGGGGGFIVHGYDNAGFDIAYQPGRLGGVYGCVASHRQQQNVYAADDLDLLIGQQVAQFSQVADGKLLDFQGVDGVLAADGAFGLILIGRNADNEHAADFIFSGPLDYIRLAADFYITGFFRFLVAQAEDIGIGTAQAAGNLRQKGVGNNSSLLALNAKTGFTQPVDFHIRTNISTAPDGRANAA